MSELELRDAKKARCEALFKAGPEGTTNAAVLGAENIVAIAITEKTTTLRPTGTGERALTFFVREKEEDTNRIDPAWNLGQLHPNLVTDVKPIEPFVAYQVECGMGVRARGSRGTGGLRVEGQLRTGGARAIFLAGAAHVLLHNGSEVHWHPRVAPGGIHATLLGHVAARSAVRGNAPNAFDLGLAVLDGNRQTQPQLHCLPGKRPAPVGAAKVNDKVWKCGAVTNLTQGVVEEIDCCGWVHFPGQQPQWAFFHEQILIRNSDPLGTFAAPGDSGSGVATDAHWVGLLFAGSPSGYFLANPLGAALDSLLKPGWTIQT